jgi:tetratricopeptide (TPR) repeat protein/DNA-binding SARP family transcriptional activator
MARPPLAFGALLRSYRVQLGLTQQELADRSGVGLRTVRDLEQGRVVRPRARSVQLLVEALGLSPDESDRLRAGAETTPPAGEDRSVWVGVLGSLVVRRGDATLDVRGAGPRCLLGLLAVQPGRTVSRDEIVDVLWGVAPPAGHANLIQVYVRRLRQMLEPDADRRSGFRVLVRVGAGYRLDLDEQGSDVAAFDASLARARQAQMEGRSPDELVERALACWRAPVLGGVEPRLALHPAVVALGGRRVEAALAYADAVGTGRSAVEVLRAVADDEPLHEGLHARLMLALAAGGQQAAALQVLETMRARLDAELGIEPGAQLQEAQMQVLRQQVPAGGQAVGAGGDAAKRMADGGSGSRAWTSPMQLPADVAGFTGRAAALARLDVLADADDAVVVVSAIDGMAGVGKTALAVHWAHRVADRFPEGQLYVNLRGWAAGEPLRPVEVLAGFLRAVGVPAEQVPVDVDEAAAMFRSMVAGRRVLVVLDNARDAAQVRPLLPGTPGCLVLVTSRDRLSGLVARDGAWRLTLDVLTPDESRQLLVRLLGERRVVGEQQAADGLARACAFLPLALRIAAAQLADQPGQRIADFVADLAGDRLGGLELPDDEQAAVRAAFDVSYARLDAAARRLFRLLGLVPGPDVTAEATAALADMPVAGVRRLVGRLVGAHLLDEHRPGRYVFHDLLRVYAGEQTTAEDSDTDRDRALHRLYGHYLAGAHAAVEVLYPQMLRLPAPPATPGSTPPAFTDDAAALDWLDAERANLVAVVAHTARQGPYEVAWRLTDALRGYFIHRLYAVDWLTVARAGQSAAVADADGQAEAAIALSLAGYQMSQGGYRQAVEHQSRALELARRVDWAEGEAAALVNLGGLHVLLGELEQAAERLGEGVALARRTGDIGGEAVGLDNLGVVLWYRGRLREAADNCGQALAIFDRLGSRTGRASVLDLQGNIFHLQGHLRQAEDHLAGALALHREAGARNSEPSNLASLARVRADAGHHRQAVDLADTALRLARETDNRLEETAVLITCATVQHRLGEHTRALGYYRQALRLARDTGYRYSETEALLGLANTLAALGEPHRALTRARHGLALARSAGFRLLEGQAQTILAAVHHRLGDHARATATARTALAVHAETGHRPGAARTHLLLGRIQRDLGRTTAAVDHWREALALFTDIGTPDAGQVRVLLAAIDGTSSAPYAG